MTAATVYSERLCGDVVLVPPTPLTWSAQRRGFVHSDLCRLPCHRFCSVSSPRRGPHSPALLPFPQPQPEASACPQRPLFWTLWVEPAHAQAPVSGFLHSASCFRVHPCRRMIVLPFYSRITFHCVGGPAIYPFVGWSFGFFHSLALMRHTAAYGSRVDIRSHLGTFLAWNRRIL